MVAVFMLTRVEWFVFPRGYTTFLTVSRINVRVTYPEKCSIDLFTRCCAIVIFIQAIMTSVSLKRKPRSDEKMDHKKVKVTVDDTLADEGTKRADSTKGCTIEGKESKKALNWTEFREENLDCDYCRLYGESEADLLLNECDKNLIYNTGELTKVFICGKWQDIPRQQVRTVLLDLCFYSSSI